MKNIKVQAISDMHGLLLKELDPCDILLICGDNCPATNHSYNFQNIWIENNMIPWMEAKINKGIAKHIVFIAGNHDFVFENYMDSNKEDSFRNDLPEPIHYLRDNYLDIMGIKIWGSPWSNLFGDWAFMRSENDLDKIYSKIPEGMDIVISHGPAFGYSDCIEQERFNPYNGIVYHPNHMHLGSQSMIKHIKRASPKYCINGHIHSAKHEFSELHVEGNMNNPPIMFACASIVDEEYKVAYKPLVINL